MWMGTASRLMPSSAAAGVRQDFCRAALVLGCALAALSCRRTPEEFAPQTSLDSSEELGPQTPTGASASADAGAVPSKPKAAANCPPDPEPNAHALPLTTLTIPDSTSGILTLEAEVAKGDHDTERGLMYRTEMPEMHGMIFELTRDDHAFWMHNTCISLDLLYIDHGQIVGIVDS